MINQTWMGPHAPLSLHKRRRIFTIYIVCEILKNITCYFPNFFGFIEVRLLGVPDVFLQFSDSFEAYGMYECLVGLLTVGAFADQMTLLPASKACATVLGLVNGDLHRLPHSSKDGSCSIVAVLTRGCRWGTIR